MTVATRETSPPAFITPLTPGRPNLGEQAVKAARSLGFEKLADWQYDFLCLLTEYEEGNPADGIVPYWRNVTLTICRQCGKSECICSVAYKLRWLGYYRDDGSPKMIYTAHSMDACYDQWNTKIGKRFRESRWGRRNDLITYRSAMNPHVRIGGKANRNMVGGRVRLLASSGSSGRGGTEDFVVMDEVREFGDDSSREKTLIPLMNMRPSPQILFTSTMGVESSGYFNRKVSAGREVVRQQMAGNWPKHRMAYAEWGVGDVEPDSYDPKDPEVWLRAHPMIGWGEFDMERMAELYDIANAQDDLTVFQQEYLNQMYVTNDEPAMPWEFWDRAEEASIPWERLGGSVVLAVHAEPECPTLSAVAVGGGNLKVVRPLREAGDVVRTAVYDAVAWLARTLGNNPAIKEVVFQEGNDLATMLSRFKFGGVKVRQVRFNDYKAGCRRLKNAVMQENIRIEKSPYLRYALQAAEAVMGADDSWYWKKKKKAQGRMDELKAAALAWEQYDRMANKVPALVGRGTAARPAEKAAAKPATPTRRNPWSKV